MTEDSVEKLGRTLGRYQALVVGGLCFIVLFAVTIMGVMLYLAFTVGGQSAKLEAIALQTHNVQCAEFKQNVEENAQTRDILRHTPQGLLAPDGNIIISAELLQEGIDQRQETIDAMKTAGLTC